MKSCLALGFLLGIPKLSSADDPDRPPPLTFDKHVDYVVWYNKFVNHVDEKNALDDYLKLCPNGEDKLGLQRPTGIAADQFAKCIRKPWDPESCSELKAYLDECAIGLDVFRRASLVPHFSQRSQPDTTSLYQIVIPVLAPCRDACKALIVESWMRDDRQAERMVANWKTILKSAQHFRDEPWLISNLVSLAMRALVYQQAVSALHHKVLEGTDITNARSTIDKYSSRAPSFCRTVIMEWAGSLDSLQYVCPDGKLDKERWGELCKLVESVTQGENPKPTPFDPNEAQHLIEKQYSELSGLSKKPVNPTSLRRIRKFEADSRASAKHNSFFQVARPNFIKAFELTLRLESQHAGTSLLLAIHGYRLEHQEWPVDLDALPSKEIKAVRIDPYSGEDYIYKLTDDGFTLYSVGADGKNDGGRHDPHWGEGPNGGDFVIWPVQDESTPASQPERKPHRGE